MNDRVSLDVASSVARIRLSRPDKINAMDSAMMRALAACVIEAGEKGAAIAVISGEGPRGLSAGADLSELGRGREGLDAQENGILAIARAISTSTIPIITVAHGRALGAGAMLPILSDIAIASSDLSLGFPEIRFNMYPVAMHAVLREKVSDTVAWQLAASGRLLTAAEALGHGLVTEVWPAADFAARADQRVTFYVERAGALQVGRKVRRARHVEGVAARLEALAPLLHENLARPQFLEALTGLTGGAKKA